MRVHSVLLPVPHTATRVRQTESPVLLSRVPAHPNRPMAAEPAAEGRDSPATAAPGDDEAAAAEALLSAASEQLTLVYQGEVYVFDPVPPQKVAPSAPFASSFPLVPFNRVDFVCLRWVEIGERGRRISHRKYSFIGRFR